MKSDGSKHTGICRNDQILRLDHVLLEVNAFRSRTQYVEAFSANCNVMVKGLFCRFPSFMLVIVEPILSVKVYAVKQTMHSLSQFSVDIGSNPIIVILNIISRRLSK